MDLAPGGVAVGAGIGEPMMRVNVLPRLPRSRALPRPSAKALTALAILLACAFACAAQSATRPGPWVADNGDGTYRNPILFADYADPDVIRVGDDYYMVSSSFQNVPGLPILHSTDLVNWELVGYALQSLPSPRYDLPRHGEGVWAPSLRYHNGEFWIYFGDPDLGVFLVKSRDPLGPWEKPVLVNDAQRGCLKSGGRVARSEGCSLASAI